MKKLCRSSLIALGLAIERVVLRPLVNQPEITLFMATIGLASLLDGLIHLTPFGAGNFSYPAFLPSGGVALLGVQVSYPQLLALGFTLAFLALFTFSGCNSCSSKVHTT